MKYFLLLFFLVGCASNSTQSDEALLNDVPAPAIIDEPLPDQVLGKSVKHIPFKKAKRQKVKVCK